MYEGYFEKCKSKKVKHYSSSVLSSPVDMPLVSREEGGKFGYLGKKKKKNLCIKTWLKDPNIFPFRHLIYRALYVSPVI